MQKNSKPTLATNQAVIDEISLQILCSLCTLWSISIEMEYPPCSIRNRSSKGPFSIAMLVYQSAYFAVSLFSSQVEFCSTLYTQKSDSNFVPVHVRIEVLFYNQFMPFLCPGYFSSPHSHVTSQKKSNTRDFFKKNNTGEIGIFVIFVHFRDPQRSSYYQPKQCTTSWCFQNV